MGGGGGGCGDDDDNDDGGRAVLVAPEKEGAKAISVASATLSTSLLFKMEEADGKKASTLGGDP